MQDGSLTESVIIKTLLSTWNKMTSSQLRGLQYYNIILCSCTDLNCCHQVLIWLSIASSVKIPCSFKFMHYKSHYIISRNAALKSFVYLSLAHRPGLCVSMCLHPSLCLSLIMHVGTWLDPTLGHQYSSRLKSGYLSTCASNTYQWRLACMMIVCKMFYCRVIPWKWRAVNERNFRHEWVL